MKSSGVTPEELLRDFRLLFESQTKTLRGLATASNVGAETIRGWKNEGRFPRSTDDFIRVIRMCLTSVRKDAALRSWSVGEWEMRYQEARRMWENQAGDRRPDEDGTRAPDDRTADRVADVITMINGVVQAPNSVFGVVKKNSRD